MTESNISGVLCIDKPPQITSHDAVNKIRRLYGTRKVGHTGTLDPMATGVMVVLIGRAAKAAEYVTAEDKRYLAGLKLGIKTDSGDITGNIMATSDRIPDRDTVAAAAANFCGNILQIPPMYSALKQNGQKLVDLARKGIEVERQARPVTIHSLQVCEKNASEGEYLLTVHCSKGTYIRTLCEDIGTALGCGGTMNSLRRTASGTFTLDQCTDLNTMEAMTMPDREMLLLPVESLFQNCPAISLNEFFAHLAHNGTELYQNKLNLSYPTDTRIRLCDANGFFALGEVSEFPDGSAVKPVKQFRLE